MQTLSSSRIFCICINALCVRLVISSACEGMEERIDEDQNSRIWLYKHIHFVLLLDANYIVRFGTSITYQRKIYISVPGFCCALKLLIMYHSGLFVPIFVLVLIFTAHQVDSAAVPSAGKKTCPCRARTTAPVSVCAQPAGDPLWCTFHMCAAGFECIDEAWSTHTCVITESMGVYKCALNENGMIIKPRPHETDRCQCDHFPQQKVRHITPIDEK